MLKQIVEHSLLKSASSVSESRRISQDMKDAKMSVSAAFNNLKFDLPWSPLFVLVIFAFHPYLGIFAIGAIMTLAGLAFANLVLTDKAHKAMNDVAFDNGTNLIKLYSHGKTISHFNVAQPLAQDWYDSNNMLLDQQNNTNFVTTLIQAAIKYVRMTMQIGVLGLGAWLVITDQAQSGVLIASSILLGRALAPVDQSMNQWHNWRRCRAAYNRIMELFDGAREDNRIELPLEQYNLAVEAVTIRDSYERYTLKQIQFELKTGHTLAIIGPSGSGKSALLNTIKDPSGLSQGKIRVNGVSLVEMPAHQQADLIGYLPQDIEFFETTVFNNICNFDTSEGVEERVFSAAKMAGIHEWICQLPNAYQTVYGKKGFGLSGGQKQQLALARAIYKQPKILLLDEPDSNLDPQAEQQLLFVMKKLKQLGTSIVVVSHRNKLLSAVDWVVVLDKGQIRDAGKRDEVLERISNNNKVASLRASRQNAN
ncbi:ATP-binding cassette domain-containing protein [Vibrio olivae]